MAKVPTNLALYTLLQVKQTCAFPRPNSMKHIDSSLSFDQAEVVDVVPVPSCRYLALGLLRNPSSLGKPVGVS